MLEQHSMELLSLEKIQSLWAGYGHICQIKARVTSSNASSSSNANSAVTDIINVKDKEREKEKEEIIPLILKLISPPPPPPNTTTTNQDEEDEGHLRKIFSYEVEQNFYRSIVPRLGADFPVARCIAAIRDDEGDGLMATLMTDLKSRYPVAVEGFLDERQVGSALDWLAGFHRRSWDVMLSLKDEDEEEMLLPPIEEVERRRRRRRGRREKGKGKGKGRAGNVWLNGGYTYLATRRKEFASLVNTTTTTTTSRSESESESGTETSTAAMLLLCEPTRERPSCSIAEMVARVLTPRKGRDCETLIHGDVKSENLFATHSGSEVAFYDFQYVGLGLGVCDLAKLFTCSVPVYMLVEQGQGEEEEEEEELDMQEGERALLEYYRENLLRGTTDKKYSWDMFVRHWETALVDWFRFQASWGFWGNTEWLEARVRSILRDQDWIRWLVEEQDYIDEENKEG
ncbi:hypothetical protein GGS20DRAFT_577586 [Poronia punctata]|nr:hypothetical protein GGS20DRAFT_577586 [Poronia punctata]